VLLRIAARYAVVVPGRLLALISAPLALRASPPSGG